MHPDLSPHLHTDECNKIIQALHECHRTHNIAKFWGKCNPIDHLMIKCMKKERIARRELNHKKAKEEQQRVREKMKADKTDYGEFLRK